MSDLREDGVGTKTRVQDTTREMASTLLASKVKATARAKAKETVTSTDGRGVFPESAPTNRKAKTRAGDSKENVTSAVRRAIPQGVARKAKKEENQQENETATKGKAKDREVGAKASGK